MSFSLSFCHLVSLSSSSLGGLVEERLLHQKCPSAMVDQIPLENMIIILNKKEL